MRHKLIDEIRYNLLEFLAGDMPVCINIAIYRPKEFDGSLAEFDANKPVLFTKNELWGAKDHHKDYLLGLKHE